jgi:hypothetical protein
MKDKLIIGKTYQIDETYTGVLKEIDSRGYPLFDMIRNPYYKVNENGLTPFGTKNFKLVNDEPRTTS